MNDKDKKLNNNARLTLVKKLRCQNAKLQVAVGLLKVQVEKLNALEDTNEKLVDQLNKKKSKEAAMVTRLNKEEVGRINGAIKFIWRKVKFISGEAEQQVAAEMVYDHLGYDTKNAAQMASWVATYEITIRRRLFACRNSFTSELKKVAMAVLLKKDKLLVDGELPTSDQMLNCALRKCKNHTLMEWYWTVVLPKVVGIKEWGPSTYFYQTPTEVSCHFRFHCFFFIVHTNYFHCLFACTLGPTGRWWNEASSLHCPA